MIIQGSPEWHQERLGRVTASRVADVLAKTKTGWGASRANYAAQIIAERLTGQPQDSYVSAEMKWGIDNEAAAKAAYEFFVDAEVLPAAFIRHPRIEMSGASPDGLIGSKGLAEIKCPNTATHIETLTAQTIPGKYNLQMQWQMACAEAEWCDFVSFDPRMPQNMQLFVKRVKRDDKLIADTEKEIVAFLKEIDERIAELNQIYQQKDKAA